MKLRKEGSLTVEAALLMPFILFVVFSLVYLAFYLHDISKIQGIVDDSLKKASFTLKHEADFVTGETSYDNIDKRGVFYLIMGSTESEKETIQNYLQKKLSKGLFLAKITEIQTKVSKWKITITVDMEICISMKGIMDFFRPISKKRITGTSTVHNPAETIRITEVILDTGQKIKGVEALKEKIEKIRK